jgi:hypothetical protein
VPSANTLVRWVNENAFASIVQARPCPTFGRPVHRRGSPHRLRPGTSPHALRIPPRDGHPALRSSNFTLRPASRYSRFWIWRPSSEHQRDFNPPEQCAAQRTLWKGLTSPARASSASTPRLPDADRSVTTGSVGPEISRFSSKERLCMPGSKTTQGRPGTRNHAPVRFAFRHANGVGTLN